MTLINEKTGAVLSIQRPNAMGESAVILDGVVLHRLLFSDEDGGSVTLGDGRIFRVFDDFTAFVVGELERARPKEADHAAPEP